MLFCERWLAILAGAVKAILISLYHTVLVVLYIKRSHNASPGSACGTWHCQQAALPLIGISKVGCIFEKALFEFGILLRLLRLKKIRGRNWALQSIMARRLWILVVLHPAQPLRLLPGNLIRNLLILQVLGRALLINIDLLHLIEWIAFIWVQIKRFSQIFAHLFLGTFVLLGCCVILVYQRRLSFDGISILFVYPISLPPTQRLNDIAALLAWIMIRSKAWNAPHTILISCGVNPRSQSTLIRRALIDRVHVLSVLKSIRLSFLGN